MAARGEAEHGDARRVDVPRFGIVQNEAHRLGHFEQRGGVDRRRARIAQHEGVAVGRQELQGDRFTLTVRRHLVAAAGHDQHGGACAVGHDLGGIVGHIADEPRSGAVDAGDRLFDVLHAAFLLGVDGVRMALHPHSLMMKLLYPGLWPGGSDPRLEPHVAQPELVGYGHRRPDRVEERGDEQAQPQRGAEGGVPCGARDGCA